MADRTPSEPHVLAAAAIVEAFAAPDTATCFGRFARDATVVVHAEPKVLERPDYEKVRRGWLASGWHEHFPSMPARTTTTP